MSEITRTVSADLGLLSPEELLKSHEGGRRQSLEDEIRQASFSCKIRHTPWRRQCRDGIRYFLDNAHIKISYDDFMTVVALFVLFGDWVKTLAFPPSSDATFQLLLNVAFFLFIAEIIMISWAKSDFSRGLFHIKGYFCNFFFWLDLLCVISMIPDLDWAAQLFGINEVSGSGVGAKAGKAGKIGAKTMRIVRMARLVRLVKLYKISSQRKREKRNMEDLQKLVDLGHMNASDLDAKLDVDRMSSYQVQKQSKVGAELSDIITRRVIVAVLLMLLVVPLLSYSSAIQEESEATKFLQAVNVHAGIGADLDCGYLVRSALQYTEFMERVVADTDRPDLRYLLDYNIKPDRCGVNEISLDQYDSNQFRKDEIRLVDISLATSTGSNYGVQATYNLKEILEQEATTGIYLTLFVVFMLVTLSTQFTGDAQKLVLAPIESMMEMVNMVANDPLEDYDFSEVSKASEYETRVVQVAIQKITSLLRIGFGVAGAEIISSNMAVEGTGSNVLVTMVPGKRVYAIFGFCDIHAFDHCTEVLEDEIMTFVNIVARIVHEDVTRWGGLCNKNLGNAFLMVWRIGDETAMSDATGLRRRMSQRMSLAAVKQRNVSRTSSVVDLRRIPGLDIVADKALIGFLKVIVEVNRDLQVLSYRGDKRLVDKSGVFNLRMGFGMHAGWAIEGAVGSLQKVDATYLSPHVNMTARMEAASRQYGVAILLTERFFELMSLEAQRHCRKLDIVTVKGSSVPMPIHTYDCFQNQVFPQLRTPKFSSIKLSDVLRKQAKEYHDSMWEQDPDLIQLRRLATSEFKAMYSSGLEYYLGGNWEKARECFLQADALMTENDPDGDGPSRTLLSFMENKQFKCPPEWKGYRDLTRK